MTTDSQRATLHTFLLRGMVCFCISVLSAAPALAQITSTIEGTVRDPQGLTVPGAQVRVRSTALGVELTATTDSGGFYRVPGLPAGEYSVTASMPGFSAKTLNNLTVTLNRTLNLNIDLEVAGAVQEISVDARAPLIDPTTSTTGGTITQQQIRDLPLNGRHYLDLMQLVPGVAVNRQASGDSGTPILGERAGNAVFLVDGLPNRNEVSGGAAASFDQDSIQEFQVLTSGYKAEFGQGSGGVVNVITKSGTNDLHATGSVFARNDALDASNTPDGTVPSLRRWDYDVTVGAPVVRDRVFFFGSQQRITESRRLNFVFPPSTPAILQEFERGFSRPARDFDTRTFARFDEQLRRHRLTQQFAITKHVIKDLGSLSGGDFPSTRRNANATTSMLGLKDTIFLGKRHNSLLGLYFQYRDESSTNGPANPDAGPATDFNIFSSHTTGRVGGDLGNVTFGVNSTPSHLAQTYTSTGANLAVLGGKHALKFGWDFRQMKVDGVEPSIVINQLFATLDDFVAYGPIYSGFFTLRTRGGLTPEDSRIGLRNTYNGLYAQDDWNVRHNLTLNLGLRWDYDSEFPTNRNISPRLGFAWGVDAKTVVRGGWGIFYDHFRLGLARQIPAFGGANIQNVQPFSYPRLFYGIPTSVPALLGLCLSPTLTDAQIAASGTTCTLGPSTIFGVDRLNHVVAPGRAPIPANAVVTTETVQQLSGLTPQAFADAASRAIGQQPGFFFFGPFGTLSHAGAPPTPFPVSLDSTFRTPHTRSFNLGAQREVSRDFMVGVDYYHKDIRNILGVRQTNLEFISRLPGRARTYAQPSPQFEINGFGPWHRGTYDAVILSVSKRFSANRAGGNDIAARFTWGGQYTWARAIDNLRCGNLGQCTPADSFVGVPPVVTETATGKTNADGAFVAANGNPVPKAGEFYNGPDVDKGPSDLALDHTFLTYGTVRLPAAFEISGILRAQSGFHFSREPQRPLDIDGSLAQKPIDYTAGRNVFTAPRYVNADVRVARNFEFRSRAALRLSVEFFNLLNRRNPAGIERGEGRPTPFGEALQVLPGREAQIGLRLQF